MPYGRVNAFLNYFSKNIYGDEPYYFSVVPSKNIDELREYGIVIARSGIYVSIQKQNNEGKYYCENSYIEFSGLIRAENNSGKIEITTIKKDYSSGEYITC